MIFAKERMTALGAVILSFVILDRDNPKKTTQKNYNIAVAYFIGI